MVVFCFKAVDSFLDLIDLSVKLVLVCFNQHFSNQITCILLVQKFLELFSFSLLRLDEALELCKFDLLCVIQG